MHCNIVALHTERQIMFAAIERFITRWMAPLSHELARMPATAQRNILIGF